MTTNFLFAQAPNRKGNQSKHTPGPGGVTSVTRPQGSTAYGSNHQGKPDVCCDPTKGRGQKVAVSTPSAYNTKATNTGYLKGSSYLK
jgi:hypothetical protein